MVLDSPRFGTDFSLFLQYTCSLHLPTIHAFSTMCPSTVFSLCIVAPTRDKYKSKYSYVGKSMKRIFLSSSDRFSVEKPRWSKSTGISRTLQQLGGRIHEPGITFLFIFLRCIEKCAMYGRSRNTGHRENSRSFSLVGNGNFWRPRSCESLPSRDDGTGREELFFDTWTRTVTVTSYRRMRRIYSNDCM